MMCYCTYCFKIHFEVWGRSFSNLKCIFAHLHWFKHESFIYWISSFQVPKGIHDGSDDLWNKYKKLWKEKEDDEKKINELQKEKEADEKKISEFWKEKEDNEKKMSELQKDLVNRHHYSYLNVICTHIYLLHTQFASSKLHTL